MSPQPTPFPPKLSVAICTHNPRADYLSRTLEGLARQTLPSAAWECLVIDNASTPPLAWEADLARIPNGRVIREPDLGLTPARMRALAEARAEIVVFADDDNVLAPDYLERVLAIAEEWPRLGAWGAGVLTGAFESEPPEWMRPLLWYVTVHETAADCWSNQPDMSVFPPGAGLAVRRKAAAAYVEAVRADGFRRRLDRRGADLSSCGDMDLLWTITDNGWGVGRFRALRLTHLIPSRRTEPAYLEKLVENMWCSNALLKAVHGAPAQPSHPSLLRRIQQWRYLRALPARERWEQAAIARGHARAAEMLRELSSHSGATA